MAKMLEFYVAGGSPIKTSNYKVISIKTRKGPRKQAVTTWKGRKLYQYVSNDTKVTKKKTTRKKKSGLYSLI